MFRYSLLLLFVIFLISSIESRALHSDPDAYWYKLMHQGYKEDAWLLHKHGFESVPDPFYKRGFNVSGFSSSYHQQQQQGDLRRKRALDVKFVPDPNPEAVPIPDGAPTISFGLVISDMPGYDDAIYSILHHRGIRMMQWRTNRDRKLVINGTVHYIDIKVLSGGPDCSNFLIAYEYLITEVKVDFLIHPVNPDCQRLPFLAESYGIPIINSPDYYLGILQNDPTLPYYNLTQLYTVAANYSLLVPSCLVPLALKGAKTIALMHAGSVGIGVIPFANAVIPFLNFTKVLNDSYFDLEKQKEASRTSKPCSYVQPYIDQLKIAKPDIFVYSMGPDFTDEFTRCLRLSSYYPPATYIYTGNGLPDTADAWMTSLTLRNDAWRDKTNVTDPLMVSVQNYTEDYIRLWNKTNMDLISYAATSSTIGTLVVEALKMSNSLDPARFRQAMRRLNVSTVIGETYLIDGPQIFYNPFLCRQYGNGRNANDSYIIFPFDAPTARAIVYPAVVEIDPVFARSLLPKRWLNISRKLGLGLGIGLGASLILIALGVLYYFGCYKNVILLIPNKYGNEEAEWGTS